MCTFILGSNQRATSIDHWQMGTWMWDVQECGWGHQVTSSSFDVVLLNFILTLPTPRLVVAGGFGDASALASTEVIFIQLS